MVPSIFDHVFQKQTFLVYNRTKIPTLTEHTKGHTTCFYRRSFDELKEIIMDETWCLKEKTQRLAGILSLDSVDSQSLAHWLKSCFCSSELLQSWSRLPASSRSCSGYLQPLPAGQPLY